MTMVIIMILWRSTKRQQPARRPIKFISTVSIHSFKDSKVNKREERHQMSFFSENRKPQKSRHQIPKKKLNRMSIFGRIWCAMVMFVVQFMYVWVQFRVVIESMVEVEGDIIHYHKENKLRQNFAKKRRITFKVQPAIDASKVCCKD